MHNVIGFRWDAVHEQNREAYSISKSELGPLQLKKHRAQHGTAH